MISTLRTKVALCLFWMLAVGTGFAVILSYQNASGPAGNAPQHWPSAARITPARDHDTLVMFAHPQCPCTRASLEELNRLLAKTQGRVSAQVWFFKPAKFAQNWTHTDLWQSAMAIPGVAVQEDVDGAQARLFGAATSGYVLLYDTHGQLRFNGGITSGRGHAGDNLGENAICALLAGREVNLKHTQVFGCSLLGKCEISLTGIAQ